MSTGPSEQALIAAARRRDVTDYRFDWWSYIGWTILTLGIYAHYATYKLVQRRTEHVARRLAFQAALWHVANERAEASGRRDEVAEGLDNLSRAHAEMTRFEDTHRRDPALWTILRIASMFLVGVPAVGAFINHFLNKDLRFYDEWEGAWSRNAEWVLGRLGFPVGVPERRAPIPDRPTALYVLLSIVTVGLFSIWWRYTMMRDGNDHFEDDAGAEEGLLRGLGLAQHPAVAAPPPPPPLPPAPPGVPSP
jgi:hypothetical protein